MAMISKVSLDAQWSVIGSMLLDERIIGEAVLEIRSADFIEPKVRHIFEACREIYFDRKPLDPVTVCAKLKGLIPDIQQYIVDIMRITPTSANWRAYAEIMREQASLHRAKVIGDEIASANSIEDVKQLADKLAEQFCEHQSTEGVTFWQGLESFFERHGSGAAPKYFKWGFSILNDMLYAEPGDFVIVGGLPSSGKTVLALNMSWTMASDDKKRVAIFSLETKDKKLYDRLICRLSGVSFSEIKRSALSDSSWEQVGEISFYADNVSYTVYNASNMTVQDIKAISLSKHYDVVFIDYLQLISTPSKKSRAEEVSDISRSLHTFAQSSGIMVVGLSQLTRPEKGSKAAPTMQSLRESGQLEQDADIVMLLYREDETNPRSPRRLKVAKNKEGEIGFIALEFDAEHMRFLPRSHLREESAKKRRPVFREEPDADPQEVMEVFANGAGNNTKNGVSGRV